MRPFFIHSFLHTYEYPNIRADGIFFTVRFMCREKIYFSTLSRETANKCFILIESFFPLSSPTGRKVDGWRQRRLVASRHITYEDLREYVIDTSFELLILPVVCRCQIGCLIDTLGKKRYLGAVYANYSTLIELLTLPVVSRCRIGCLMDALCQKKAHSGDVYATYSTSMINKM